MGGGGITITELSTGEDGADPSGAPESEGGAAAAPDPAMAEASIDQPRRAELDAWFWLRVATIIGLVALVSWFRSMAHGAFDWPTLAGAVALVAVAVVAGIVRRQAVASRTFPISGFANLAVLLIVVLTLGGMLTSARGFIDRQAPRATVPPADPLAAVRISAPFELAELDDAYEQQLRVALQTLPARSLELRAMTRDGAAIGVLVVADAGLTNTAAVDALKSIVTALGGTETAGRLDTIGSQVVARADGPNVDLAMWAEPPFMLLAYTSAADDTSAVVGAVVSTP